MKMDTIFINYENSKMSEPHVLILKQILVFTINGKTQKAQAMTLKLKYQLQHENIMKILITH